jgi:iron complex outermembrane receptor protein
MRLHDRSMRCALWFGVAAGIDAARAQDEPAALERVEIVGSHLKQVEREGPAPVTVYRRADLAASGAERLGEFLLAQPLAGAGGFDDRSTGFGPQLGSAGLSLRGLGPQSTLVLLNGRRVASYGVMLDNDGSFVDLNSLPLAAVERVEILRDGASAIYGADAIGGVVNIVTRNDFDGVEVELRGGGSTQGDSWRRGVRLGAGLGDLAADGWNAFIAVDASRQDATPATVRSFSRTGDQRARGGLDRRSLISFPPNLRVDGRRIAPPDCPPERLTGTFGSPTLTCKFDISPDTDLLPQTERQGVLAVGSFAPGPSTRLFAELVGSRGRTAYRQAPATAFTTIANGAPGNPYDGDVEFNWRVLGDPRRSLSTVDFASATLGAEGLYAGWDWTLAAGSSRIATRVRSINQVRTSLLDDAIAAGTLTPLSGELDAAAIQALTTDIADRWRGASAFVQAQSSTDLVALAHGPLQLAVGTEFRRDRWSTRLDPLTLAGDIGSTANLGTADVDARRRVAAAYAEVNWPAAPGLELQLAARHDSYSDYGSSTSPKLALRWQPAQSWLLRASTGRGFLPPSLAQINRPRSTEGFGYGDPARCQVVGEDDPRCFYFFTRIQEGNPALQAERSRQHNVGAVVEPVDGFSVAIDFWRIEHADKIVFGETYILDNEQLFPGRVVRAPPTPEDVAAGLPGAIVEFRDTYINVSSRSVRGVDLEWRGRLAPRPWGRLAFDGLVSYLDHHDERITPQSGTQRLAGRDGRTRVRAQAGVSWSHGAWRGGARVHHIGRYRYEAFPFQREASPWTSLDLSAGWTGGGGDLTVVLRNATDREPPMVDANLGYDPGVHDPMGRTLLLAWRVTF